MSDELERTIRIEQGRIIERLALDSSLQPKQVYERKGRLYALNTVLHHIENDTEPELDDDRPEAHHALGEALADVFGALVEDSDGGTNDYRVDDDLE